MKPIKDLSDKLKISPGIIVISFFAVSLLLIIIGAGSTILTAIIGFLYPAYMTFKAIES